MVIAIDGPAGSGKSSIAKKIANQTDALYVNSGSMYRAITHLTITHNLHQDVLSNKKKIIELAANTKFRFENDGIYCNDDFLLQELRTDQVDSLVSLVSSIPELRIQVNEIIHKIAESTHIIVEGRDMTTVAFPNAEYKFYMDASVEARAKRRFKQGTSNLSLEELKKSIQDRDTKDKEKAVGGLKIAPDAKYLDTSDLTIDQVCEMVLRSIQGLKSQEI
jgi:cytidylate kinase